MSKRIHYTIDYINDATEKYNYIEILYQKYKDYGFDYYSRSQFPGIFIFDQDLREHIKTKHNANKMLSNKKYSYNREKWIKLNEELDYSVEYMQSDIDEAIEHLDKQINCHKQESRKTVGNDLKDTFKRNSGKGMGLFSSGIPIPGTPGYAPLIKKLADETGMQVGEVYTPRGEYLRRRRKSSSPKSTRRRKSSSPKGKGPATKRN